MVYSVFKHVWIIGTPNGLKTEKIVLAPFGWYFEKYIRLPSVFDVTPSYSTGTGSALQYGTLCKKWLPVPDSFLRKNNLRHA